MDSEKHTELFNYFINKDMKYPERIYNLSPKKRDNEKANFRRLVEPFNVKMAPCIMEMLKQLPEIEFQEF